MRLWLKILVPLFAFAAVFLPILLLWRRCRRQLLPGWAGPESAPPQRQNPQPGIARLQQLSHRSSTGKKGGILFYQHHHHQHHDGEAAKPFDWDEHPRLAAEAVENGWARFVFAAGRMADSFPGCCTPVVWGLWEGGGGGAQQRQESVETNWEVPVGASEFLQTIRLNPKPRRSSSSNPLHLHGDSISMARMLLPLPGPPLGVCSFPKEAYFEITILYIKPPPPPQWSSRRRAKADASAESDRAKLILEKTSETRSVLPAAEEAIANTIQETKAADEEGVNSYSQSRTGTVLSLGLAHGGTLPSGSLVGTYQGSIGFHSNGSLFLDGTKLVFESEKAEWAEANRVLGCGYDPGKKKVFFTADSQLLHVVNCNSDIYRTPLFPLLATNTDAMFLVNLGQSKFRYEPANARRTANPCFIRTGSVDCGEAAIGDDDSRELFSMGRIDAQWSEIVKKSQSSGKRSNANHVDASSVVDIDADSDLFEISLHI